MSHPPVPAGHLRLALVGDGDFDRLNTTLIVAGGGRDLSHFCQELKRTPLEEYSERHDGDEYSYNAADCESDGHRRVSRLRARLALYAASAIVQWLLLTYCSNVGGAGRQSSFVAGGYMSSSRRPYDRKAGLCDHFRTRHRPTRRRQCKGLRRRTLVPSSMLRSAAMYPRAVAAGPGSLPPRCNWSWRWLPSRERPRTDGSRLDPCPTCSTCSARKIRGCTCSQRCSSAHPFRWWSNCESRTHRQCRCSSERRGCTCLIGIAAARRSPSG
eukprot:5602153-Prymnesium_polylepis.1